MKKSLKTVIVILLLTLFISAVFGYVTYHDNGIYQAMQEQITVSDKTVELQKGEVEISINDVVNINDLDCTALFENGNNKLTINAKEVSEQPVKIIVTANNTLFFDKTIELNVQTRIVDTTPPEFTESVDEIKITEGDELDILNKFQAEDISGNVALTVKGELDNTKTGDYTITVIAKDINGNVTEKEVKIIVGEKAVTSSNNGSLSSNGNNRNSSSSSNNDDSSSRPSSHNSSSNSSSNSKPSNSGSGITTTKHECCRIGNCGRRFNSYDELNNYYLQWAIKQGSNYSGYFNGWQCSCGKWSADFISY